MKLLIAIALLIGTASAADIYITQATSGSDTGANCANAHSAAWFNSNSAGGNIYHLCGTFTGTSGQNMLLARAGSAGNLVTIMFESGAVMTAPYWGSNDGTFPTGGAITLANFVTVDGGTNGAIQNTLNGGAGTSCLGGSCTDHISAGMYIPSGVHDVEIKNLNIHDIFRCNGVNCTSIYASGIKSSGGHSNISIHDNIIAGTSVGIYSEYSGSALTNINYYNNTISDNYWGINIGSGSAGNTTSGVNIYGNTISGCATWNGSYNGGNGPHCDGIIVFTSSTTNVFNIYNNTINYTGALTGSLFCSYGSSPTGASCNVFNNVLIVANSTCAGIGGGRAYWMHDGAGSQKVWNNTLVGNSSSCFLIEAEGAAPITAFENNILTTENWGVERLTTGNVTLSDYNLYNTPNAVWKWGSSYDSFATWQGRGFDAHGASGNPNLDANYKLQASSTLAIAKGTNLTSTCSGQPNPGLGALCFDKAGVSRPSSGAWDIGAYQYAAVAGQPNAPTNLTVIVH